MSYQEEYKQKLKTADEAVKAVKSGDWVDYGWSVCTPKALDKALAKRSEELTDVKLRGGILTSRPAVFDVPNVACLLYTSRCCLLCAEPWSAPGGASASRRWRSASQLAGERIPQRPRSCMDGSIWQCGPSCRLWSSWCVSLTHPSMWASILMRIPPYPAEKQGSF